jgi:hypothetical protein
VVGKINDNRSQTFGFNAQTEEFVDLVQAGIVDPAKVVRVALQDAASVAGLLITTEAMAAEAPRKESAPAMPGGGGMGGMDFKIRYMRACLLLVVPRSSMTDSRKWRERGRTARAMSNLADRSRPRHQS